MGGTYEENYSVVRKRKKKKEKSSNVWNKKPTVILIRVYNFLPACWVILFTSSLVRADTILGYFHKEIFIALQLVHNLKLVINISHNFTEHLAEHERALLLRCVNY